MQSSSVPAPPASSAAIEAGQRNRRVLLLEHSEKIGKKILISGRRPLQLHQSPLPPENFLSANPHFAKSALARYTPADFIALVEQHNIAYHEKTLGPALLRPLRTADHHHAGRRECRDCRGADRASMPKIARDSPATLPPSSAATPPNFAHPLSSSPPAASPSRRWAPPASATTSRNSSASKLSHRALPLVPLVFSRRRPQAAIRDLAGVSTEVIASAAKRILSRKNALHPSRPQRSRRFSRSPPTGRKAKPSSIDLAPDRDCSHLYSAKRRTRDRRRSRNHPFATLCPSASPNAGLQLYHPSKAGPTPPSTSSKRALHSWKVRPAGTEGFEKAEVTAGGIDTAELSAKPWSRRKVPGLFFIGEVVDVTGHLGGFNFQWAWASAAAAGRSL